MVVLDDGFVHRASCWTQTMRRIRQLHHLVFAAFAFGLILYALRRRDVPGFGDWRELAVAQVDEIEVETTHDIPDIVEPISLESNHKSSGSGSADALVDATIDDLGFYDDYDNIEGEETLDANQDERGEEEDEDEDEYYQLAADDHTDNHEIFSSSTRLRKPLPLFFDGVGATDPSLIPHHMRHNEWLIVAKDVDSDDYVVCPAGILDDVLICSEPFTKYEESPLVQSSCSPGQGSAIQKIFYGPDAPYTMSMFDPEQNCTGSWMQDARMTLDAFKLERYTLVKSFQNPVSLTTTAEQKSTHDTNPFVFWDADKKPYLQQRFWPERKFSAIEAGGRLGPNLAADAAHSDKVCMAQYMPSIMSSYSSEVDEHLEQATNSLSVTLCRRTDPRCSPSDSNTVLMHVVQKTTKKEGHVVAEPYVVLFNRTAPFALHAIAENPFWIHGRAALSNETEAIQYEGREDQIPTGQTEMYNVASISWKTHGLKYHGYIDDVVFIGFGVEKSRGGAIDVQALDLLQDMSFC